MKNNGSKTIIQGGSNIFGMLSKLTVNIKINLLKIILPQTVSAVCRSINKHKKTHSSKDIPTGSYKSCDSLQTSRLTYHKRGYELWKQKKDHCYDAGKKIGKLIEMNRTNMRR